MTFAKRIDWANSVVLISSTNNQNTAFGSGFVVYCDQEAAWVVTCAHVINDIEGQTEARVKGRKAQTIACGSDALDLAVLKAPGLQRLKPFPVSVFTGSQNDVIAIGYESLVSQVREAKRLNGKLRDSVEFTSRDEEENVKAWKIRINPKDGLLQRGYSGGPVIDTASEKVVGVLSHSTDEGREGRAISIAELQKIWKEMPTGLLKPVAGKFNDSLIGIVRVLLLVLALAGCVGIGSYIVSAFGPATPTTALASPTSTSTFIPTTQRPSATPTSTATPTFEPTTTPSRTPTATSTPTLPTHTPSTTPTVTTSPTSTNSPIPSTPGPDGPPVRFSFPVESVAVSSSGDVAVGLANGEIQILRNRADPQPLKLIKHSAPIRALDFSPDHQWLASTADDQNLIIWNTETGEVVRQMRLSGRSLDIDFSPDGGMLTLALNGGTAQLFAFSQGQLTNTQTLPHLNQVWSVAFAPGGDLIATGSKDTNVWLWQYQEGQWVNTAKLFELDGSVTSIAFSPDGKFLAAGSEDKTITLWQIDNGKARFVRTLFEHTDYVRDLAFSPDSTLLVSASEDNLVRVWRVSQLNSVVRLPGHRDPINGLAFSPDGVTVISVSDDFTMRYWRVK